MKKLFFFSLLCVVLSVFTSCSNDDEYYFTGKEQFCKGDSIATLGDLLQDHSDFHCIEIDGWYPCKY